MRKMTRRIGPRSVGALGLTALACAGLAAAAFAGVVKDDTNMTGHALASQTVKFDSKVTLAIDGADCSEGLCAAHAFHGRVKSSKHACEVLRTVKVFRVPSGKLVGKARSNRRGKWGFIQRPPWAGRYQAKVVRFAERRPGRNGAKIRVCRRDRSKVIDLH